MTKKVAIVTDTHWGVRNDNPHVLNFFCDFFENQFFPTLLEENVDYIIHCGDLVDRRKFVNFNTATRLHQCFTENIIKHNMHLDVIVGNHDCAFKNTNRVNALNILYSQYSQFNNIRWFIDPTIHIVKDVPLLYLPWICEENYEESLKLISNSHDKAKFIFGHLELMGFEMYKGAISDHGLSRNIFEKYQKVISGHFHHRSQVGNIHYVGTPYEMMWSDWNDPRGFEIMDLEDGNSTFYPNNKNLFHVIDFSDVNINVFNYSRYKNSFIKIVYDGRANENNLEIFIENLNKVEPIEIVTINENELDLTNSDIDLSKIEDTMHTLTSAVDTIDDLSEKQKIQVKEYLYNLYIEAQQVKD